MCSNCIEDRKVVERYTNNSASYKTHLETLQMDFKWNSHYKKIITNIREILLTLP